MSGERYRGIHYKQAIELGHVGAMYNLAFFIENERAKRSLITRLNMFTLIGIGAELGFLVRWDS